MWARAKKLLAVTWPAIIIGYIGGQLDDNGFEVHLVYFILGMVAMGITAILVVKQAIAELEG